MCWRCSLMPIKVLDANRSGTTSAVAAGVVWAVDHGAQVISMSLGGTEPTRSLAEAVAYGVGKGVILIAAAGNEGSLDLAYPAGYVGRDRRRRHDSQRCTLRVVELRPVGSGGVSAATSHPHSASST